MVNTEAAVWIKVIVGKSPEDLSSHPLTNLMDGVYGDWIKQEQE